MTAFNEWLNRRRQHTRRRRRWAKRLAVCAVLAVMVFTRSPKIVRAKPAPEKPGPDATAIGWMIAQSWLSPGDVPGFAAAYPELADLFISASMGPAPWTR